VARLWRVGLGRRLGDRAETTEKREAKGALTFQGAVENERVWSPDHEGNRRREEAKIWYPRISLRGGAGERDGLGSHGEEVTMPD
jgi:hypothetical protein